MDKQFAIFDFDGTLADSMDVWRNLGRNYLVSKGIKDELEETVKEIYMMTLLEASEHFINKFLWDTTTERIIEETNEILIKHYKYDIQLKDGVLDYIKKLKSRGVRMCIATATDKSLVTLCAQRLGILDYFEFIISCEDINVSKREPDVYLISAERFGASPSDIAVFEDASYAINTALKAGFYVVGVWDGQRTERWERIKMLTNETIDFSSL